MTRNAIHLFSVLAAGCAALLPGCRSVLYRAAARGDAETVQEELYRGADPQARISPAHYLWKLPAALAALPADAAQLVPYSLTGGYFGLADWNDCSLVRRALFFGHTTPRETAMQNGHFEVAQMLADYRRAPAPQDVSGAVIRFSLQGAQAAGHEYSAFGKAQESRWRAVDKPMKLRRSAVYNGTAARDYVATVLTFNGDNRAAVQLCNGGAAETAAAVYERTGDSTARISVESAGTPCTYYLHFTGPRSGTAEYEYAGLDAGEHFFLRVRNMRFELEAPALPEELLE